MRRKSRTSLEAKLCLLTVGLLFAVLLGVGHFALKQQEMVLVEQERSAFEALAKAVAFASEPVVAGKDDAVGQKIVDYFKQSDLEMEFIVISDQSGRSLFAYSRGVSPRVSRKFLIEQTRRVARYLTGYASAENVYRTTVPVRVSKDKWGTVAVGFSMGGVNASIDELQTSVLLIFAVALIVGILGSVAMARGVSMQPRRLIESAKAVAAGDLTRRVAETSTDEVGELSMAFNVMVKALHESQERLIERANTDSLTDLYNHRYFQERLGREISRAERYGHVLSVLMLDIDHFKAFNDRHGHPNGDRAIREIATILKAEVRDIDVVARYGGEEFAVVLPETGMQEAFAAAERLRVAVQRHCFYGKDGETVPMTISLGAAQYPIHSAEREGLIMAADMALYRAKSTGRNMTCRFEQELQDNPASDPYKVYVLLRATDIGTVEALADAIDSKHHFTIGHGKLIARQAANLAHEIGMTEDECESVRMASLLRDIGQLALPDSILTKNEELSPDDRELLASHPALGHAIVQKSPRLKTMLPGILHHHENYDGTGYPFGLKGEEIPKVARVIAIVDAYYAMTANRPHREKMTLAEARAELQKGSGKQFDSEIVNKFIAMLDTEEGEVLAA
jgi:diguanylate cyclase (GGDEF)-like protein